MFLGEADLPEHELTKADIEAHRLRLLQLNPPYFSGKESGSSGKARLNKKGYKRLDEQILIYKLFLKIDLIHIVV